MSTNTMRQQTHAGIGDDIGHGSNILHGIVRRNFPKKTTSPDNPCFREIALDNLTSQIRPKTLTEILSVTINSTIFGSDSKIRKLLMDIYPIIREDFNDNNISIEIADDEPAHKVLMRVIGAYDRLHPDYQWSFIDQLGYCIEVERNYDKFVPVTGYSVEMCHIYKLGCTQPFLFHLWKIIANLFKRSKKAYFWFELYEHEASIEQLKTIINEPQDYGIDIVDTGCLRISIREMNHGKAFRMEELISYEIYVPNDLIEAREYLAKSRIRKFKNEMLEICDLALACVTADECIGDFLHINPDDNADLYENGDPLTMHDYMQFLWRADDFDPYWNEVQQMGQFRWDENGDGFGFSDKFILKPNHIQPPPMSEFPGQMRDFFLKACELTEKIIEDEKRRNTRRS